MNTDDLNSRVTQAIWGAEHLEEQSSSYRPAWLNVSRIEDELAMCPSLSSAERHIARRGAVSAALKAGEHNRAQELVQKYHSTISPGHYQELCSILTAKG